MGTAEMNQLLKTAELVSRLAHRGQRDLGGFPYYEHPRCVAQKLSVIEEQIVAYLHDVLEDTDVTEAELRSVFGDWITDHVKLMTHEEGVSYMDYVKNLSQNTLCRHVKLADLTHNMDLKRIPYPAESDLKRYEKYKKAYAFLMEIEENSK